MFDTGGTSVSISTLGVKIGELTFQVAQLETNLQQRTQQVAVLTEDRNKLQEELDGLKGKAPAPIPTNDEGGTTLTDPPTLMNVERRPDPPIPPEVAKG